MRAVAVALALAAGCASTPVATVSGGCDPGIEYQGRNLNLGASYGLVGISVGVSAGAVREVSDLMQIYMQEAANLCDLHARGALDALAYAERRAGLAERFARLVRVGQAVPPAEVEPEALPLYRETLDALRPDAKGASVAVAVRVEAEGQALASGAALRSGTGFRLFVETGGTAWVYVVLVNASGEVSRLYPAALTAARTPSPLASRSRAIPARSCFSTIAPAASACSSSRSGRRARRSRRSSTRWTRAAAARAPAAR